MTKKVCTVLLQRNLPDVTEEFANVFFKNNDDISDFFVVESGSDKDNLTEYQTFHADWEDATQNGLRTGRGFNFALKSIESLKKSYEFIFMVTGDTKLPNEPYVQKLVEEMESHKKMGVLTPISPDWGERVTKFNNKKTTMAYGRQIPHICWMFRKKCIDDLVQGLEPNVYGQYLYDGENFRCYGADTEIMMKMYSKDWFFGITSKTMMQEDYELTEKNYKRMKTDSHSLHRKLMWEEGLAWIKEKFGVEGKVPFNNLLISEYEKFFIRNPDLVHIKY